MSVLRRVRSTSIVNLSHASKVVCIGRNYADHVSELKNTAPKQPFFFLKPPSSILVPGAGPMICPRGVDAHYEVELALVMGENVKDLSPDDVIGADDAIAGYAVGIDMTARNVQNEAKKKGLPWDIAKGFDTFLPISKFIYKRMIPDPHQAELWLNVNGEKQQEDSTELMLFRIPRILSDISRVMTLKKGDIVLTGTPKGVGPVVPGDVITAGIRVGGREVEEGRISVKVEAGTGPYEYKET